MTTACCVYRMRWGAEVLISEPCQKKKGGSCLGLDLFVDVSKLPTCSVRGIRENTQVDLNPEYCSLSSEFQDLSI